MIARWNNSGTIATTENILNHKNSVIQQRRMLIHKSRKLSGTCVHLAPTPISFITRKHNPSYTEILKRIDVYIQSKLESRSWILYL